MQDSYINHGIQGINPFRSGEQRTNCPECPSRMPYKHQHSRNDKDLAVNTDKGTWLCHRCGWSGALRKESIIERPTFKPILSRAKPIEDKNMKYFESRGITKSVVERNNITKDKVFMPAVNAEVPVICFNYYVGDDLVNIKFRDLQKNFSQVKGGAKVFYKLNDLESQTECIITEGEFDALSFEVAGYKNAISVPEGGINPNVKNIQTKLDFLDNCADYFDSIKKIYLATDADAPGVRLQEELARRLGKSRCYIVKYPEGCKDANEVLVKFGKNALIACINSAEPYPIKGLKTANDRRENIMDIYENGYPNGARTGWELFDSHLQFFDSFLTVITGIPSHGKSNFLDNLMLRLAVKNGWKFAVFSPENGKIDIHVHRLAEILIGKPFLPNYNNQMTRDELLTALNWISNNILFIEPDNEEFTLSNILDIAKYCVIRYGIKGLVIDPWNTILHEYKGQSETEYTKDILNKLTFFERNHGLHLFLVAHPSKMKKLKDGNKYEIPTLYDISGSANWYNKAEIGITIYREYSSDMNETKHTLVCIQKVKHKFIGRTGTIKFDFDLGNQRYFEQYKHKSGTLFELLDGKPIENDQNDIEYTAFDYPDVDF